MILIDKVKELYINYKVQERISFWITTFISFIKENFLKLKELYIEKRVTERAITLFKKIYVFSVQLIKVFFSKLILLIIRYFETFWWWWLAILWIIYWIYIYNVQWWNLGPLVWVIIIIVVFVSSFWEKKTSDWHSKQSRKKWIEAEWYLAKKEWTTNLTKKEFIKSREE